jgi:hypothetical protein
MNLVDALSSCSDILEKFGGHELAAGLSVTRKNLPIFREEINKTRPHHRGGLCRWVFSMARGVPPVLYNHANLNDTNQLFL